MFDLFPPVAFTLSILYSKPKQNLLCCHCKGTGVPASQPLTPAQAAARCCSDVTSYHTRHQGFCSRFHVQKSAVGFCLLSKALSRSYLKGVLECKVWKSLYKKMRKVVESLVPSSLVHCSGAWPQQRNSCLKACDNSYY